MPSTVIAQGIPVGPELLILLLVFGLLAVPVVLLVVGLVYWSRRRSETAERVEELEAEVERLKKDRDE